MPHFVNRDAAIALLFEDIILMYEVQRLCMVLIMQLRTGSTMPLNRVLLRRPYSIFGRLPAQVHHMNRLVGVSDIDCLVNLRMDRNAFGRLCLLFRQIGTLKPRRFVGIEEQVAMFLGVLAHHKKNRVVGFDFWRSGHTVSTYVHAVMRAVLNMHSLFLVKSDPVNDDCNDSRWKWFKGCLGALDGTYINVLVGNDVKPRYRTRKGQISTNTLAACDRRMRFVYILPGWEGSAGDARVLRDAINRPNGFRVPKGNYYLCDNGYANSEGFLTPYKGVRYHLKEWGHATERPRDANEMFNMRHTKARNIIERAFAVLKMRWGILRSPSFYPLKVQIRLIMCCFLLHNFIRGEMVVDPIEQQLEELLEHTDIEEEYGETEYVDVVEPSPEWNLLRDTMAQEMVIKMQLIWLMRVVRTKQMTLLRYGA